MTGGRQLQLDLRPLLGGGESDTERAARGERAPEGERVLTERVGGAARSLTAEQHEAVARRSEPLSLAAGAGSGKTSVLVERFAQAVCEDRVSPERILAITFTERAAGELRERVRGRLSELGERSAASASAHSEIGTFHGFCSHILRAREVELGFEPRPFEFLDEALAGRLRRRAFAQALGEFVSGGDADAVELIAACGADRARTLLLRTFAELRSRGQRVPQLPHGAPRLRLPARDGEREASDREGAAALVLWDRLLGVFGERYEQAKHARGGLDFDDLELIALELLQGDAAVRGAEAERFQLLMVDELQDVNARQLGLLQALARGNLFTVGDRWQAIYGFRHADVNLFGARERELAGQGRSLQLTRNFRGRPALLAATNSVFSQRFGEAFTPLRAGREDPPEQPLKHPPGAGAGATGAEPLLELLLSDRRGWGRGGAEPPSGVPGGADQAAIDLAAAAPPWRQVEARELARRVYELIESGVVRAADVAVLMRGTGDIECYEQALRAWGLDTLATVGAFWERQEVCDLICYLRALANSQDEVALYGVLASPYVGLSRELLALIARTAHARGQGAFQVACEVARGGGAAGDPELDVGAGVGVGAGEPSELERAELARLEKICSWLEQERERIPELALAELLARALEHTGYRTHLSSLAGGERRLANAEKLQQLAAMWEQSEGRDLPGFLAEAAFQQRSGGGFLAGAEAIAEPDALVSSAREAVRLMSVHAAKGLEFEVVCLVDLGRAPSAGQPDLLVDGERVGLRLVSLRDGDTHTTLEYEQLASERRAAQAQEEDRILYVAMTRARERLLLSGAVDFASWPRDRPGGAPVAWLAPALAPEIPVLCREMLGGEAPGRGGVRSRTQVLTVARTEETLRCTLCTAR